MKYTVLRQTWINNVLHTPGDPETGTVELDPKSAGFYLDGKVIADPATVVAKAKPRKTKPEVEDTDG